MRVLIACEFSGAVRDAFARMGHDAWSCDLDPPETPGRHIQGDVRAILNKGWDLMIAHPPCTYLCASGLHWNKRIPGRQILTEQALEFVQELLGAHIPRIALENPMGCISTRIRKPEQIIQPYQFGENASKSTCLWLKNLPLLKPSRLIEPRWVCCGEVLDIETVGKYGCPYCNGENKPRPRWANQTNSGQNRLPPSANRGKERSRTYAGIAEAMAQQWGGRQFVVPVQQELFSEQRSACGTCTG